VASRRAISKTTLVFIEDPPKGEIIKDRVVRRRLLGITNPPTCFKCKRLLRVVDNHLEAVDP
jgi:hypothetical protein